MLDSSPKSSRSQFPPNRVRLDEITRLGIIISVQTEIAHSRLDVQGVMNLIAERAQSITDADGAVIELADGDEMIYCAASGSAASSIGVRIKAATSLSGLCVAHKKVLCCDDSELDTRVDREACRRVGLRSMIVVPLHQDTRCAGVLKVLSFQPHYFDDADVRLLQLMAGLAAYALGRAAERAMRDNLMAELEITNERLAALAKTDALTELSNRRCFDETLRDAYAQEIRRKGVLSLILIDVDNFKSFNDEFGHPAGDDVLRVVAAALRKQVRAHELVARYGGEEFVVVLPGTDRSSAMTLAELLRARIENLDWSLRPITISLGVSTMVGEGAGAQVLVDEADEALYRSKRRARNCATHHLENHNDPAPEVDATIEAAGKM